MINDADLPNSNTVIFFQFSTLNHQMVETVSPPILAAILGSKSRTRFEKVIIIMTKLDPFWGTL
jgi:hypothetical protein